MPLPESWRGLFWDPQSHGNLLVDSTPERFIAFLACIPNEDYVFLVAGACVDLQRNGLTERAHAIMAAAKARWPEFLWHLVEGAVDVATASLPSIAEGDVPEPISKHWYGRFQRVSRIARGLDPVQKI